MAVIKGRVIKLLDKIVTDIIILTKYMTLKTVKEMAAYAFSLLRPELFQMVRKGNILVGGLDFGCGSFREQAPEIIKVLWFSAVAAKLSARIFYKNAINNGLVVIQVAQVVAVSRGHRTRPLKIWFSRVRRRRGYQAAIIALARSLVTIAFCILRNLGEYDPTRLKAWSFA